jgi:hypothetical protein
VLCRNLKNVEALARVGLLRQRRRRKKKKQMKIHAGTLFTKWCCYLDA